MARASSRKAPWCGSNVPFSAPTIKGKTVTTENICTGEECVIYLPFGGKKTTQSIRYVSCTAINWLSLTLTRAMGAHKISQSDGGNRQENYVLKGVENPVLFVIAKQIILSGNKSQLSRNLVVPRWFWMLIFWFTVSKKFRDCASQEEEAVLLLGISKDAVFFSPRVLLSRFYSWIYKTEHGFLE